MVLRPRYAERAQADLCRVSRRSGSGGGGNSAPTHSELSVIAPRIDRHLQRSGCPWRGHPDAVTDGHDAEPGEFHGHDYGDGCRRGKRDSAGHLRGTKSPEWRGPCFGRAGGRSGAVAARADDEPGHDCGNDSHGACDRPRERRNSSFGPGRYWGAVRRHPRNLVPAADRVRHRSKGCIPYLAVARS